MFTLKTLLRELVLPPALPLMLMLAGAVMARRGRRFGPPLSMVGFVSLWLFCTPLVADGLTALAERYPALNPDLAVNAQAVVVLGGGMARNHAPEYNGAIAQSVLLERLDLAAFLAKRYRLPLAISGTGPEVVAMEQTLSRDFGVVPRWVEGNSRDTYENAQLSAKILLPLGMRHVILVTSGAHEWRAAHEFMGAGFEVTPAPISALGHRAPGIFHYIPGPAALTRSNAAMYELIGEAVRQVLATLRIREKLDSHVAKHAGAGPPPGTAYSN